MALYDLRFTRTFRRDGSVDPVISFPAHSNQAHWQVGMDVHEKLALVAAAQENGTVKLFSLRSGLLLPSPALEGVTGDGSPVKAIMFKTVPGDKGPSLFVGEGAWVRKFTWGALCDES